MANSFFIASDIETKQFIWSCFKDGKQVMSSDQPQVQSSSFIASSFSVCYADDVKSPSF